MKCLSSIPLGIDMEMMFMENIVVKYIPLADNVLYTKDSRYPIMKRKNIDKYHKLNMISDKPYYPILVIPMIVELIEILATDMNPHKELLRCNPLIDRDKYTPIYSCGKSIVDEIVQKHIPNISSDDYMELYKYVYLISNKILSILEMNPLAIYKFDLESPVIKLIICEDIITYRYFEAMDYIEHNTNKEEVHG